MNDTQWPRFEVFVQSKKGQPHKNVGAVHAPDGEMALQNARDVFVRRPDCASLWVVPARAILARSYQELAEEMEQAAEEIPAGAKLESYHVFQKQSQRRSMTYVVHSGQVEASSPYEALSLAIEAFGRKETFVWWICPASAVISSADDDIESMFAPALDKAYRLPREYRVLTEMLEATSGRSSDENKAP